MDIEFLIIWIGVSMLLLLVYAVMNLAIDWLERRRWNRTQKRIEGVDAANET